MLPGYFMLASLNLCFSPIENCMSTVEGLSCKWLNTYQDSCQSKYAFLSPATHPNFHMPLVNWHSLNLALIADVHCWIELQKRKKKEMNTFENLKFECDKSWIGWFGGHQTCTPLIHLWCYYPYPFSLLAIHPGVPTWLAHLIIPNIMFLLLDASMLSFYSEVVAVCVTHTGGQCDHYWQHPVFIEETFTASLFHRYLN